MGFLRASGFRKHRAISTFQSIGCFLSSSRLVQRAVSLASSCTNLPTPSAHQTLALVGLMPRSSEVWVPDARGPSSQLGTRAPAAQYPCSGLCVSSRASLEFLSFHNSNHFHSFGSRSGSGFLPSGCLIVFFLPFRLPVNSFLYLLNKSLK